MGPCPSAMSHLWDPNGPSDWLSVRRSGAPRRCRYARRPPSRLLCPPHQNMDIARQKQLIPRGQGTPEIELRGRVCFIFTNGQREYRWVGRSSKIE